MPGERNSSNWSASKSNYFKGDNNMIDKDTYSYQFGNSLAKGRKVSSSYTSKNDIITASSSGIQKRPLADITLSISNTNERQNVRKHPTFPTSNKENDQFPISPDKTAVCKGKTPNASSVNSTTKIIFFNGKSDLEAKLNFPTTSAEDFEKLRTTHDSLCLSDSFNGLEMDEENATACDMSHINENLENEFDYQLSNEDVSIKRLYEKYSKENSSSSTSDDSWSIPEDDALKRLYEKFSKEKSSSSTSDDSWSISDDDTLQDLISPGSFTIDPQKKYQVTESSSSLNQNLSNEKKDVKRKLNFGPDLCKSPPKCFKLSQNEDHKSQKVNTQSSISDYFKIKKFSSNECQNNLTSTNLLELPDFEEPIKSESSLFDNDVKLTPTSENFSKIDAVCESQNSQIFSLDGFTNGSASATPLTDSQKKINDKLLQICKNEAFIYTGPKVVFDHQIKQIRNAQISKSAQDILLKFIKSLTERAEYLSENETSQNNNTRAPRLSIPYDCERRQRRSSLIIYLLGKIYTLITQNAHCTQRQLYYELKAYASKQCHIASALMSISLMMKVAPWYLPINSTSVGLVFGNLKIITSNDNVINCLNFGGTLIPQDVLQIKEFQSDAAFIFVVEKDAIFKKLLDENISQTLGTSCIVITGKGFPDYNTRLFLKLLWRHLRIPVFVLTDGDPYGIEIMLTYRFGSISQPHFLEDIAIPQIRWIGILPSDINRLVIPCEDLNEADVVKVQRMIKRPYVKENQWLHNELTIMLESQKKAGIEAVLDNYCSLTKFYITGKLFSGDFF